MNSLKCHVPKIGNLKLRRMHFLLHQEVAKLLMLKKMKPTTQKNCHHKQTNKQNPTTTKTKHATVSNTVLLNQIYIDTRKKSYNDLLSVVVWHL